MSARGDPIHVHEGGTKCLYLDLQAFGPTLEKKTPSISFSLVNERQIGFL